MPVSAAESLPRLPKRWPRSLRSAVLHAVTLARVAVTSAGAHVASGRDARLRLAAENERLRHEIALLTEELRIKDIRMARIPPRHRPHYPPIERMAILELRAARGWTAADTADRMFVTPATIASWMGRLNDDGPDALVQTRQPVNRFPEFVAYIVRRLRTLCPTMGKERIAWVLCRAGLHLGATTVGRMLREQPEPAPDASAQAARRVSAYRPNHLWNVDFTAVPIGLGFWVPWCPLALPQRWPFCWWVAVVIDHYSRRVMGFEVFTKPPSSAAVQRVLDAAVRAARTGPKYLITDHGRQFTAKTFRRWCRRRGIGQRFGAVGKYGSLAVVERFIRTLKDEGTRRMFVPFDFRAMRLELESVIRWYNHDRPHAWLNSATPDEIYHGRRPAPTAPRYEPRRRWPRGSPCASPQAPVRGRRGVRLDIVLRFHGGRKYLPVVDLKRAA